MSFSVDPAAVAGFAALIGRAHEDSTSIHSYVGKYAKEGTGGELFQIAHGAHQHATSVIDGTLNRLVCLLETCAPELRSVVTYYQQTDLTAAARIDQTLPGVYGQCATALEAEFNQIICKPVPFSDAHTPEAQLRPPPEPDNPNNPMAWMDYLSPASWALKACDIVFGFDPVAYMQEKFFGDWEALATMQPVATNAGLALHDLALNIQSGATTLHPMWSGNAGDAAYRYFTDLATAIDNLTGPMAEIGKAYRDMAEAVWAAGEAVGGVLKGLIDAAVIAGIAGVVGTATIETGVGPVVGYAVAGVEIANMLRLWGEATKFYQNASAAVMLFRGIIESQVADLDQVQLPVIGGGAGYDHPLVTAGSK